MKVVTFGSGTTIFATVVYKAKLASDPTKPMFVVLVRSKDTTSVGLALEGLLLLTGKLLRKEWFSKSANEPGCTTVMDEAGYCALPGRNNN